MEQHRAELVLEVIAAHFRRGAGRGVAEHNAVAAYVGEQGFDGDAQVGAEFEGFVGTRIARRQERLRGDVRPLALHWIHHPSSGSRR
jgi:hypothetical protein